jgi:hypothetical protein
MQWPGAALFAMERQDRGMVSFAEILSEDDAEAIRMFVIRRANESVK